MLLRKPYSLATLLRDAKDYVVSCGCKQRKRPNTQKVAMLPSRFLRPGGVPEMGIQDMGELSEAGNRYLLVAVDKGSTVLFTFPIPPKETLGMARKLLDLVLSFGIPLLIRSDPGTEFMAEVVEHLCRWPDVSIAYGPVDHDCAQGTVERLGGRLHEVLAELCKA